MNTSAQLPVGLDLTNQVPPGIKRRTGIYRLLVDWRLLTTKRSMESNILDSAFQAVTEETTMEMAADVIIEVYRM
jgi:hypothetical protein